MRSGQGGRVLAGIRVEKDNLLRAEFVDADFSIGYDDRKPAKAHRVPSQVVGKSVQGSARWLVDSTSNI